MYPKSPHSSHCSVYTTSNQRGFVPCSISAGALLGGGALPSTGEVQAFILRGLRRLDPWSYNLYLNRYFAGKRNNFAGKRNSSSS